MTTRGRRQSLSKLEEKKAELEAQIKALKREERKKEVELEKQRFAIMGRALAKELAENDELASQLEPILNARVTRAKDRALLGLEPLPAKTAATATGP